MSKRRHSGDPAASRLQAAAPAASIAAATAAADFSLSESLVSQQPNPNTSHDAGPVTEAAAAIEQATVGLWVGRPSLSAREPPARWQIVVLSTLIGGLAGVAIASPEAAAFLLTLLLAVPFLCVVALRTVATVEILRAPVNPDVLPAVPRIPDPALPIYSLLVPLFDEADVLPRLLKALGALDYPSDRLDILLILEEADPATRAAILSVRLPSQYRVIVVPDVQPRTKPKALNYALAQARGSFVVVYDAEDIPEPGQLRGALAVFARSGPELACLQARLNIDRPDASLLTRQFTLEYSALFDALLPALERLALPVPLGGTSNHFRADVLRRIGAWDPFNMTEDADLGIRLARLGYRTETFASTTWEEAPADLGNWLRQRTRWLKGWMQTYLVHTRHPRRLLRDLGARGHLGFHVLMGGILLSVLAYPVSCGLLAVGIWQERLFAAPDSDFEGWLWWIAAINLGLGVGSSMLVAALAVVRRQRAWLAPWVLLMPVYWLLISLAGYRALVQLVRQPFLWEKTRHGQAEE